MLEAIAPHAAIISAVSSAISAIAVLISTWFIIWTTCFRKTEREMLDDLKFQIGGLFAQKGRTQMSYSEVETLLKSLDSKRYQKGKYEKLVWYAYEELRNEGKVKVEVISDYDRAHQ